MANGKMTQANKASKGFSYTPVLVAVLALGGAYLFTDKTATLNRFGEAVTERLCDLLPKTPAQEPIAPTPNPTQKVLTKGSIYNPKLVGGESYNAKGSIAYFL